VTCLRARVVAVPELTPGEVAAMYRLFEEHYQASPEVFGRDLAGKGWAILFHDEDAAGLRGFTTLAFHETVVLGQRLSVVYSGDTLIHPAYWGTPALPRTWIKTVLALSAEMCQPLYWLLITSGYKTYRFLPLFYKEFFPRHDQPTPAATQALLEELARERFGQEYRRELGVVRFEAGATPLRDGVAELTAERLKDPHVAFWAARNPGHARGDELVCLTRIHVENLTAAGRRMVR
jgi:hypothetical protein